MSKNQNTANAKSESAKTAESRAGKAEHLKKTRENIALQSFTQRLDEAPPVPVVTVQNNEHGQSIAIDHPDRSLGELLLMEALGTTNPAFSNAILKQLATAASDGRQVDEQGLRFLLAVITDIKPKDQIMAMLAAQAAVIHLAVMTVAAQFLTYGSTSQQASDLSKLVRTFTVQVDALQRYGCAAEQQDAAYARGEKTEERPQIAHNGTHIGPKTPANTNTSTEPSGAPEKPTSFRRHL